MESKPDDSYEDPQDVQSISHAMNQMGDYKLKTNSDYVVPDSERISVDGKWKQLLALEKSIFEIQETFNDGIRGLRDRKKEIIGRMHATNEKLEAINYSLGLYAGTEVSLLVVPEMDVLYIYLSEA